MTVPLSFGGRSPDAVGPPPASADVPPRSPATHLQESLWNVGVQLCCIPSENTVFMYVKREQICFLATALIEVRKSHSPVSVKSVGR